MRPQERANETLQQLDNDLASKPNWRFMIPGWEPIERSEAEHWLRSMILEGFYVAYRANAATCTVELKYWEYGDDEPEWNS